MVVTSYASHPVGQDRINVNSSEAFTRAEFSVGHEYGHLVIDRVYNALPAGYNTCSNPHYPGDSTSIGCAYSEALATAHAMDIFGTSIESSDYAYYETSQDQVFSIDGLFFESRVARYLTDVLDPVNASEAADGIDFSPSFLTQNLTSCSVLLSGSWISENGLDHLHFCFEDAVDSALTNVYFYGRPAHPTAQSSHSDALSPSVVLALRDALLYTLYGQ